MDEVTRERFLLLVERPIAELSFRELGFLLLCLDRHEDEVLDLCPELAALDL